METKKVVVSRTIGRLECPILCLWVCGDSQQSPCVPIEHGSSLRIRAIHLLDLFRRHPVAQVEGIVGANHDVIRADHAF